MKEKEIVVSVIILTYNHQEYIGEALESVVNQITQHYYEIIVSDDASDDETLTIVNSLKKKYSSDRFEIEILRHKENVGTTINLCDAIENARGEYLVLLAGDDYWCDNYRIENQVNWLVSNLDYLGICNSYAILRGNKLTRGCVSRNRLNRDNSINTALSGGGFLGHSTMFRNIFRDEVYRQKCFQHISSDKYIEDISMYMILYDCGKFFLMPGDVSVYRVRKSENNYNSRRNYVDIYSEHIKNIVENDKYFNGKYDFYRLASLKTTIALIKATMNFDLKGLQEIWSKYPTYYKSSFRKLLFYNLYILVRYRIRGYF